MKQILILLMSFTLLACSSNKSQSTLDFNTDFNFSTVNYFKVKHQKTDFIYNYDAATKLITDQLIQKGMQPIENGKPDAVFHFILEDLGERSSMRLGVGTGTSVGNVGVGIGGGIPIGKKHYARVQIRVFDNNSKEQSLIWKYYKEVKYKTDEEKKEGITQAVIEMLKQFPPSTDSK